MMVSSVAAGDTLAKSLRRNELQRAAEPDARAQKFLRIDRVAVDARLVVQMRPGRASGGADPADDLPDADRLTDLDVDLRQMRVARGKAVAVIDLDHLAVAAVPARDRHRPGGGRACRLAGVGAEVEAGVHRGCPDERIG